MCVHCISGFRLIPPTSMTLNELERRKKPYFAFFSPNLIAFLTNYAIVVEYRPIISVKYCPLPIYSLPLLAITNQLCSAVSLPAALVCILYCVTIKGRNQTHNILTEWNFTDCPWACSVSPWLRTSRYLWVCWLRRCLIFLSSCS